MGWIEDKLRNPIVAGVAVASVGTIAFFGARWAFGARTARLPKGVVPPRQTVVPFADLKASPVWPVQTSHPNYGQVAYKDVNGEIHGNGARRFDAPRDDHHHAGIDLYGYAGDPVVAIADGVVVATQTFHLGTSAILVAHDDMVALYGEVDPGSWKKFGVTKGSRVGKGDPIARIGCMVGSMDNCDSHMLHFESYAPGTTQNKRWQGSTPPAQLRDPTIVLLAAGGAGANA